MAQIAGVRGGASFFHHFFLVPPSQTHNPNRAIIHRQCSIENCVRLQRRTHHPPQNIFGGSLKKGQQFTNKAAEAAIPHPKKCTPNRSDRS